MIADGSLEPVLPGGTGASVPALVSTRRLLGASFDLLSRANDEMRRASFYIGTIVVGTVAPFALAAWAFEVRTLHLTVSQSDDLARGAAAGWYHFLLWPMALGVLIAAVESRNVAIALLGGRLADRPLTTHQAIARSRTVFWRAIGGAIIVGIPLSIAQATIEVVLESAAPMEGEGAFLAIAIAAVLVGAPLTYVLSGIVLGDVGAWEATRRSFGVYRARKVAASIVALFEVTAFLLIYLGLGAGLDIALRLFDGLGLGVDSGPAGLTLVTLGIVAVTFAFGTLLYTVTAISLAPQVVMFVGLTRATMGLDRVRAGGDHDPASRSRGRPVFRVITRSMWALIAIAWLGLAITIALLAG